jgi:rRNA pseudouridine-1189 N-methylase Emg1 (Nep1/Mra1 family)
MTKIEKKIQELETKLEEKLMSMPQKSVEELLKQSEMLFSKKGKI